MFECRALEGVPGEVERSSREDVPQTERNRFSVCSRQARTLEKREIPIIL